LGTPLAVLDLRVTLDDALGDLIAAYEVAGRSPRTTQLFDTHIRALARFLAADGVTTLDEVTGAMVTRFLAAERRRGLKASSLSISLRTIRTFFGFHVAQGNLTANPAKTVLSPTVTVEPVQFLNDDQVTRLLVVTDKDRTVEGLRDGAFIRVLRDTGIRRGELLGLTVDSVDLDARTITVRAITSKARKGRTVPISKDTAQKVRTYLRVRQAYLKRMKRTDNGMLWIAAKGDLSGNGALQALHRRLRAAGLPKVGLHQWRHRWAATVIADGLPMPYVVSMGGWANAVMPTSRYGLHGVEGRAISAMQALLDR